MVLTSLKYILLQDLSPSGSTSVLFFIVLLFGAMSVTGTCILFVISVKASPVHLAAAAILSIDQFCVVFSHIHVPYLIF